MTRQILTLGLVGLLPLFSACGDDTPTAPTAPTTVAPTTPAVTTSSVSIAGARSVKELESVTLTAQAQRSNGTTVDVTQDAEWTTDAPQHATVAGGVVHGVAIGNATLTVTYDGQSATHSVDVTRRDALACLINPTTEEPYGLAKRIEEHPRFGDDWLRVTYRWTNDCTERIRLYDMRITVWDSPDRTGTHAGRSYPDDIDISGRSEAEVVDDVSLSDGVRAGDIESPDNVRMNFSVRYVNQ
jgi:hypothetical protein